jgi:hypothetical protein
LPKAHGQSRDELLGRIAVVDNDKLEKLVKAMPLDKSNRLLLKAELEAKAERRYTARLWASEVGK